jgi:hypothetical protein
LPTTIDYNNDSLNVNCEHILKNENLQPASFKKYYNQPSTVLDTKLSLVIGSDQSNNNGIGEIPSIDNYLYSNTTLSTTYNLDHSLYLLDKPILVNKFDIIDLVDEYSTSSDASDRDIWDMDNENYNDNEPTHEDYDMSSFPLVDLYTTLENLENISTPEQFNDAMSDLDIYQISDWEMKYLLAEGPDELDYSTGRGFIEYDSREIIDIIDPAKPQKVNLIRAGGSEGVTVGDEHDDLSGDQPEDGVGYGIDGVNFDSLDNDNEDGYGGDSMFEESDVDKDNEVYVKESDDGDEDCGNDDEDENGEYCCNDSEECDDENKNKEINDDGDDDFYVDDEYGDEDDEGVVGVGDLIKAGGVSDSGENTTIKYKYVKSNEIGYFDEYVWAVSGRRGIVYNKNKSPQAIAKSLEDRRVDKILDKEDYNENDFKDEYEDSGDGGDESEEYCGNGVEEYGEEDDDENECEEYYDDDNEEFYGDDEYEDEDYYFDEEFYDDEYEYEDDDFYDDESEDEDDDFDENLTMNQALDHFLAFYNKTDEQLTNLEIMKTEQRLVNEGDFS